jgi:hypothetical protein
MNAFTQRRLASGLLNGNVLVTGGYEGCTVWTPV